MTGDLINMHTDDLKAAEFTPMSVLVDTLKRDEVARRVKVIENLHQFCMVLGPLRTREEMIPFIKGMPPSPRVHGR